MADASQPQIEVDKDTNQSELARAEQGDMDAQFQLAERYKNGHGVKTDNEQAAKWYQKAAEQGHSGAQFNLGMCYRNGLGVPHDDSLAVECFRKAADQCNANAQNSLGWCYRKALGVPHDDVLAVEWYRKAAGQGHPIAQSNLGRCYLDGLGVPHDDALAAEWFSKAADQGNADAQINLGWCYLKGLGVPIDVTSAVGWFRRAAEKGNAKAQFKLGSCYQNGLGVPHDDILAVEWYRKAAEQGLSWAQFNLGDCYENGIGAGKDNTIAVDWYRRAADQGNADAQDRLGRCYENGMGVNQDLAIAVDWYRKAAQQGHSGAMFNLGWCHDQGIGVPQDHALAVEWFREVAEKGNADAQNKLGWYYTRGVGVDQDDTIAYDWYRKAAEQGNASAQYNLGLCYENGRGVVRDEGEAKKWYSLAAEQGNAKARSRLNKYVADCQVEASVDNPQVQETTPSVEQLVGIAIQQYRAKLIDLSSRNSLISFRHSDRSRSHIRVVDEIPEKLFGKLEAGRSLTFDPIPEPELVPADETLPLFEMAFRKAKKTDETYHASLAQLGPQASDRQRKKVERELRNRVRAELGLAPFEPAKNASQRAAELGINTNFDLQPNSGQAARRFNDLRIQTLFFRDELDRKLGTLQETTRVLLQDAGISALYCAFGFLEYYESSNADEKRVAPLVFYPVTLDREIEGGEYRYFIKGRNEEIEINVALRELLQQLNLELPAWVDKEDDPGPLECYFSQIEQLIKNRQDWKLRRYVTVGLFTFSTLAMYKDLDPDRWPNRAKLDKHELIRTLVAGAEVHGSGVAEDYEIDELKEPEPLFITDADSSQHSAVLDVLRGRNCVIQGPPGTGKSQTITNLISAAMHKGKSVLFVAEKMAALEVVKKRLTVAGLEPFCLELHSSKTSKTAVAQSLGNRLEYRLPHFNPLEIESNLEALERTRKELIYYVRKANEQAGKTCLRIRDILLGNVNRSRELTRLPMTIGTTRFKDALSITPQVRSEMLSAASNLEEQTKPLTKQGNLAEHPWRGIQNAEITELETDHLLELLKAWEFRLFAATEAIARLSQITLTVWPSSETVLFELCGHIRDLPTADKLIMPKVFSQLGPADARVRLKSGIAAVEAVIQQEAELREFAGNIEAALRVGSVRIQDAYSGLVLLRLDKLTLSELREVLSEWEETCADLSALIVGISGLERAYGAKISDLESGRAACSGIELLRSIPRELWLQREAVVLDENNASILQAAAAQCAVILRRRAALADTFDVRLLPTSGELRRSAAAMRSTNFLSAMFNMECRRARQIYRTAVKIKKKNISRIDIADELLSCAEYMDDENQFTNDPEITRACGGHFKGLNTQFSLLLQLNSWSSGVRQRLAGLGDIGICVRDFLFTARMDKLYTLNACGRGKGYDSLQRCLSRFSEERNIGFDDLTSREGDRHARLLAAISDLESSTFSKSVAAAHLPNFASVLGNIEKQNRIIDKDPIGLGLIGGSTKEAENNLVALKATLRYAERLAASDLADSIVEYLFQNLIHISSLMASAEELLQGIRAVRRAAESVCALAKIDARQWCGEVDLDTADLGALATRCRIAIDNSGSLQDYINFLQAENVARDAGLEPVLAAFINDSENYHNLTAAVELVFYRSAAEQIFELDPRLKQHSGANHEQLRRRYQQLDREYLSLRRKRLANDLVNRSVPGGNSIGRVADLTELALVQHISGQTRPRIPLRELFRRAGTAIKALKPCWMMSPMSVAQFLEPGALEFDLVVMDEASQIRPEEALGAIARAKQMVVVGDQMQLPPTPFFQKLSSESASDSDEDENVDVKQESILETAAARFFPPRRLKWHYRSEHGSLISFSNSEFYNNQLTVFPSPHHDHPEYGVKLRTVSGVYGAGINHIEATAVVEAAAEFMKESSDQSLGIVAINSKQAELIREQIDRLLANHPEAEAYRAKWADTLESLFVKNLENVQGDERDVIFISTVYGKDECGSFYQRFGPINSEYGHRRLNVLFTRAKKKVIVFTSMNAEDIVDEGRHWGVRALKGYLRYARDRQPLPTALAGECESEFEEWVLQILKESGYQGVPQLGFAGYRIDIAVRHPQKPGTFICGIECDGAAYHSARSARERDRLRQEVLERLGWNIYRIWSTDWFRNPSLQTKNLLKHICSLVAVDDQKQLGNLQPHS